ncbi:MAG: response regulator transcription factor [Treponema sp.]|nr:response regulator transcription factor [Spirochaetia bacterium]MDD7460467.1 response regulator transcription factor [Spirochaetales bacterium]MDY5812200.1 response regulator transcription factor [Treponema sp.]MEE1182196.1 response regulator transcription factor [Treponema sp.]
MKTQILVIEDVPEMSQLICLYMTNAGYETTACEKAEDALAKISTGYIPDLVLLDLNLPGMNGFEFLKKFRAECKPTIPVMIVSARDADDDIIQGLGLGADEFVTKPFSPKVLVAKVQSRLARLSATEASVEETIKFGPYTLYCNSCVLKRGSDKIALSTKEYEVLEYLARNGDKPVTPEQIYSSVWKTQFGDMTAVGVYIQRLRKKIEDDPSQPKYIVTMFGMGYKFNA